MEGMVRPTFPLRFSQPRLRELVRVVADREGISQNELLEQAAEHEIVARGALLAEELEAVASDLRAMTALVAAEVVEASVSAFIEGERLSEPMRPHMINRQIRERSTRSRIGAVAAFERG